MHPALAVTAIIALSLVSGCMTCHDVSGFKLPSEADAQVGHDARDGQGDTVDLARDAALEAPPDAPDASPDVSADGSIDGPADGSIDSSIDVPDLEVDASEPDSTPPVPLTWGGPHTEAECLTAGGTVYSTGSGTLCRFNSATCPAQWSQADNWQRYASGSWGGDYCGSWKSTGPTTFSNQPSTAYTHGPWVGCDDYVCPDDDWIEMANTACGNKLHRAEITGTTSAGNTNRADIGCI